MNVLFLTQVLPFPLDGGQKIRAYYMLRQLAQSHRITLVSFVRDDDRIDSIDHLKRYCTAVYTVPIKRSPLRNAIAFVRSAIQKQPVVILRDGQPAMWRLLAKIASNGSFDVIHADQTSMAQYALTLRSYLPPNSPPAIILDQHNALHLVVLRQSKAERGLKHWLWQREARLLAGYEKALCRQFDSVLTVTEEDKRALVALFNQAEAGTIDERLKTIPICVNVRESDLVPQQADRPEILHIGTMIWPPNVEGVLWFIRDVLPIILGQVPSAHFTVAGKNPPARVTRVGRPDGPLSSNLTVYGYVKDPESLLRRSRVFIVPVHAGGGMRVKILDAWRWGIPIVSTTIGAEGIAYRDGENILIGDSAPSFAEAVLRLLTDSELAQNMRENGRRWVEQRYDWRKQYPFVEDVYQQLFLANGSR